MEVQIDVDGMPYVMWGKHKIRLENNPVLEKRFQEKAQKELRETPENIKNGLEELRRLLKGEIFVISPKINN